MRVARAGRLLGIGLGPGDPELVTLKAVRLLQEAAVVAFFCKKGGRGHARAIVERYMPERCEELPLVYPVTTEISVHHPAYAACLAPFYDRAADDLAVHLDDGRDVALLCEGDPLFYGSLMHLYVRLRVRFAVEIVPGVSGMSGCWTAAGLPMTWSDDVLTVVPATLPFEALRKRLVGSAASVVMKIGRNLAKVRDAVAAAGRSEGAVYVERGTMTGERVVPLRDLTDEVAPYFSIVLIPGLGRRF